MPTSNRLWRRQSAQPALRILFTPPYSPDFNPIENFFSKLKAYLRKVQARTKSDLDVAIVACCATLTRKECENFFLHCGYGVGAGNRSMARFASHLPVTVVAELVGLNAAGRANMLRWAAATFNILGGINARWFASLPRMLDLRRYVYGLRRETLAPDGWAARLFQAADAGGLSPEEAQAMVIDYVAPALDTTILATGQMLWRLGTTPGRLRRPARRT